MSDELADKLKGRAALEALADALVNAVEVGIASNRFQPDQFPVVRRTVSTSSGDSSTRNSEISHTRRPAWISASAILIDAMSSMPAYAAADKIFGKGFRVTAQSLVPAAFEGLLNSAASREMIFAEIIPVLQGEDLPINLLANMMGLRAPVNPWTIKLATGEFEVRSPRQSDLEWEIPAYEVPPLFSMRDPDSIVEVHGFGRGPAGAAKLVRTVLAGFRLASTGGCSCDSFRLQSAMPVYWRQQLVDMDDHAVGVPATIFEDTPRRQQHLQQIFDTVLPRLEEDAYLAHGGARTEVGIAFERYARASSGIRNFEERLALAVMAMEALLLSEPRDLRFALAVRIARLLGALGLNPDEVQSDVKLAYDVRSEFVHGGRLSSKRQGKIEQRYGSTEAFLVRILDTARRTILACLFPTCSKTTWIEIIDRAMIGSASQASFAEVFGRGLDQLDLGGN